MTIKTEEIVLCKNIFEFEINLLYSTEYKLTNCHRLHGISKRDLV